MEDSDASSTRKRPRLDSGSKSYRSMSADQAHSTSSDVDPAASLSSPSTDTAGTTSSETVQFPTPNILSPSKLPINVRDSSTNTAELAPPSEDKEISGHIQSTEQIAENASNTLVGSALGSGGPSPLHSPEIEVAEIEDIDGEFTQTRWRPIGGATLLDARNIEHDLLMDFPFLDRPNNLVRTVTSLVALIEKSKFLVPG